MPWKINYAQAANHLVEDPFGLNKYKQFCILPVSNTASQTDQVMI